ncbi:MAG: arginine deiminase-related protein [Flavobacteriales bacterium]|nr:arginine deiminase-related protein [Flavobacteriales bacterium]
MIFQTTDTVLLIRPVQFRANEETAVNNYFQAASVNASSQNINNRAQQEFDELVLLLRSHHINVLVMDDKKELDTPDSIFPNNWLSTHEDGTFCIYPMFAKNRRRERRDDVVAQLAISGFVHTSTHDFSHLESQKRFLEGTGSMVLDRVNRIAYSAISERTHLAALVEFSKKMNYQVVSFCANQTVDDARLPIYHTNVMMCIGSTLVLVCLDSLDNKQEREALHLSLKKSNREIILLSETQVMQFAGNMLELRNTEGKKYFVMSTLAFQSLEFKQVHAIEKHGSILHSSLETIETCGGGSARCMIAEIFLPKRAN